MNLLWKILTGKVDDKNKNEKRDLKKYLNRKRWISCDQFSINEP